MLLEHNSIKLGRFQQPRTLPACLVGRDADDATQPLFQGKPSVCLEFAAGRDAARYVSMPSLDTPTFIFHDHSVIN